MIYHVFKGFLMQNYPKIRNWDCFAERKFF